MEGSSSGSAQVAQDKGVIIVKQKLQLLLDKLVQKEADLHKKEQKHLQEARSLLAKMDRNGAFVELKSSRWSKAQAGKVRIAIEALSKQLAGVIATGMVLTDDQKAINLFGDSSSSSAMSSDSSGSSDSELVSSDSSISNSEDEQNSPRQQHRGKSLGSQNDGSGKRAEEKAQDLKADSTKKPVSSSPIQGDNAGSAQKYVELTSMMSTATPGDAVSSEHDEPQAVVKVKKQRKPKEKKDADDLRLDRYIQRWRKARNDDLYQEMRNLRKKYKRLKRKLKKERLRVGMEFRRVVAENKVLKQQNTSMLDILSWFLDLREFMSAYFCDVMVKLLHRAKAEIKSLREQMQK